mgnify:CR=1 FL=1
MEVQRTRFGYVVRWGEPGPGRDAGDVTALVKVDAIGVLPTPRIRCLRCRSVRCEHARAVREYRRG